MSGVVNKTELAAILGTTLPTLDKMLRRHGEAFPVVQRGRNGVEYEFDPEEVLRFLRRLEDERVAACREKDELMRQYTLPGVERPEDEGVTPRDLLTLAKLRQLERDEATKAGFLAETSEVRRNLTDAFARLRRFQDQTIAQTLRDHNLPESVIRSITAAIADAQRRFVADTAAYLEGSAPSADAPSALL